METIHSIARTRQLKGLRVYMNGIQVKVVGTRWAPTFSATTRRTTRLVTPSPSPGMEIALPLVPLRQMDLNSAMSTWAPALSTAPRHLQIGVKFVFMSGRTWRMHGRSWETALMVLLRESRMEQFSLYPTTGRESF